MKTLIHSLLLVILILIVSGCSGGSGGSGVGGIADSFIRGLDNILSGIDGTGGPSLAKTVSIGTVNSKTNTTLNVNGVEYFTDDGEVLINGDVVTSTSAIVVGDIVTINGEINNLTNSTGVAISVRKETDIIGPVSAVDDKNGMITVLQQDIIVPDDFSLETISIGDLVEVIGFPLSDNSLDATRISASNDTTYVFTGKIRNLDIDGQSFFINNQKINTGSLDISRLNNGDEVSVSGVSASLDNTLTATTLRVISSPFEGDIDTVEVEGFVTGLVSEFDFNVNGVSVIANRQTEFVGNTSDKLVLNTKVEVEGTLDTGGNLQARRIIFLVADLVNFKVSDTLTDTTETFIWSDVGADEYRLKIQGLDKFTLHDEYYDGSTTSATVSGLPANRAAVDVTISTRYEQWWSHRTIRLLGVGHFESPRLLSHEDRDRLSSTTEIFTWNDVGADEYRLHIINSRNSIHDQRYTGSTLQEVVSDLPRNSAYLEIIISARHGNWWVDTSYRRRSVNELRNAEFTSHRHKDRLSSSTETFTWTDVGADGYRLSIQSLSGFGRTFYSQDFDGNTTSVTIDGLPLNNARLAVRLHTNHNGFLSQLDHEMFGAGTVADAELTSHVNLEQVTSTEATFAWSEIPNAEQYIVSARAVTARTNRRREIYRDDFDSFVTSTVIDGLPRNGAYFDLTIRTLQDGWWGFHTYRLKGVEELDNAELLSHSPSDNLIGSSTVIEWSDVGADEYVITVAGNGQIYDQQFINAGTTSTTIRNLPADGSLVEIIIKTGHDDWWVENKYRRHSR